MSDLKESQNSSTAAESQVYRSLDAHFRELIAELRLQAYCQMKGQRFNHTLQPTALVNEVYLKLANGGSVSWKSRAHFLKHASFVMRSILIDYARAKSTKKRQAPIEVKSVVTFAEDQSLDLLALDMQLTRLGAEHPEFAKVVEMRFFAGATVPEVAEALGTSVSSVERKWVFARAYLKRAPRS